VENPDVPTPDGCSGTTVPAKENRCEDESTAISAQALICVFCLATKIKFDKRLIFNRNHVD
jgi:hypothetical protein